LRTDKNLVISRLTSHEHDTDTYGTGNFGNAINIVKVVLLE